LHVVISHLIKLKPSNQKISPVTKIQLFFLIPIQPGYLMLRVF
jgi:hypothetical protein